MSVTTSGICSICGIRVPPSIHHECRILTPSESARINRWEKSCVEMGMQHPPTTWCDCIFCKAIQIVGIGRK